MDKEKYELLAPGGSYDSILAAYEAGADAVYTGGTMFGARAYANNLTEEQLLKIMDYAHLRGKKLYLTVNTLLKNQELDRTLYDYLKPYYENGLDAVIVQDPGVMSFVHKNFPDLPIHASTQMTVTNVYSAGLLKTYGVTRIITPRELSLQETGRLKKITGMEIEAFVHGALCYCYSGQCLMSSMIGGRSGNRGRCAQPCRLPYDVEKYLEGRLAKKREAAFILSLKDLCALELLPQLINAGVTSFKIEGRMKSPEYTAGVVSVYRKYLDRILEGQEAGEHVKVSDVDRDFLVRLFSRNGFTDAYFSSQNDTGKGNMVMMREREAGPDNKQDMLNDIHELFVQKPMIKTPVNAYFSLHLSEPAELTLTTCNGDYGVTVKTSEVCVPATKKPTEPSDVAEKLMRLGNSPFELKEENLYSDMDEGLFFPVGALNQLRRTACEKLEQEMLLKYRRKAIPAGQENTGDDDRTEDGKERETILSLRMANDIQVYALKDFLEKNTNCSVRRVYLYEALLVEERKREKLLNFFGERGIEVYAELSFVFRKREEDFYGQENMKQLLGNPGISGFLVHSQEQILWLKQLSETKEKKIISDAGVYALNREAYRVLHAAGADQVTFSYEMNRGELIHAGFPGEMVIYGRIPMMVTAQCPNKMLEGRCTPANEREVLILKDRKKLEMPVVRDCRYCCNIIYNSVVLDLFDEAEEIRGFNHVTGLRVSFTTESNAEEVKAILAKAEKTFRMFSDREGYREINEDKAIEKGHFTRGHYRRGVD